MPGIISWSIVDEVGKTKSIPMYFSGTPSEVQMQSGLDEIAATLDAVIDGKIVSVSVTRDYTLPGGLKADAVAGAERQRGALLRFDPENTARGHSMFVPTWKDAGFVGEAVAETGAYQTFQNKVRDGDNAGTFEITDAYFNDITAYLGGTKSFRK